MKLRTHRTLVRIQEIVIYFWSLWKCADWLQVMLNCCYRPTNCWPNSHFEIDGGDRWLNDDYCWLRHGFDRLKIASANEIFALAYWLLAGILTHKLGTFVYVGELAVVHMTFSSKNSCHQNQIREMYCWLRNKEYVYAK